MAELRGALLAIVLCCILGHCEMSIYPGLRRRPVQPPALEQQQQYELNSDFLAQLMEENARRRLQQQFEQQLELIKLKMQRQRQLLERERYRQRQQELQVLAESEDDYNNVNNNNNNQQYDQYDNAEGDAAYGSPMEQVEQAARPPSSYAANWNYNRPSINANLNSNSNLNLNAKAERIPFAVGPQDSRFFDNPIDPSGELDSRALDDYEEYAPVEQLAAPQDATTSSISKPAKVEKVETPKLLDSAANFHRIKPQTAAAAAVAGVSLGLQSKDSTHQHEISALIDKLQKQSRAPPAASGVTNLGGEAGEQIVLRQHLGMSSEMGVYIVALIAGVSAAVTVGLLALGVSWLHRRTKAAADVDYPAYGVTGPNKDVSPSGDRKLAQSAQMYHYQHQKQQIIAMENCQAADGSCGLSDVESDDDNEEGDYTVYECPGLAPTGEMEVKNPLFNDETPATPANQLNVATSNGTAASNNITQATPQQPATLKKGTVKPQMNLSAASPSVAAEGEKGKNKKTKK